jgi:hypothetical protein
MLSRYNTELQHRLGICSINVSPIHAHTGNKIVKAA